MHRLTFTTLVVALAGATPARAQQALLPAASETGTTVELGGALLLNTFYSDADADPNDIPTFVLLPATISGEPATAAHATLRQSRLVFRARNTHVLRGELRAEVDVDFFDGSTLRATPRLRRAVAALRWPNAWLVFGQEAVPLSPIDPSSFATVAVPGFTHAGNLSRWMPQVRFGTETLGALRVGVEAAALSPLSDQVKLPFLQGRLLARWGDDRTGGTIAVGGHYGWFESATDTLLVTQAVGVSASFFITPYVELRGEGVRGEALETLGGGGIGQDVGPAEIPLPTSAGWVQLNFRPTAQWELGGGYGLDDPDDAEVAVIPVPGRLKNVAWELHLHWRPRPVVFAVEYRRLETTYGTPTGNLLATLNHVNVTLGAVF